MKTEFIASGSLFHQLSHRLSQGFGTIQFFKANLFMKYFNFFSYKTVDVNIISQGKSREWEGLYMVQFFTSPAQSLCSHLIKLI